MRGRAMLRELFRAKERARTYFLRSMISIISLVNTAEVGGSGWAQANSSREASCFTRMTAFVPSERVPYVRDSKLIA